MIQIYHNPRCSKSRQGVALLEDSGKAFETISYLKDHLTAKALKTLIEKLNITPLELVRKNEAIWKEKYKTLTLSDSEVIDAMVEHPKLIERPIIVNNNKAVIGRPTELINNII